LGVGPVSRRTLLEVLYGKCFKALKSASNKETQQRRMLRTIIISSRGDYLQFPSKDAIKAFGLLAQNNEEVLTAPHGVQITQHSR